MHVSRLTLISICLLSIGLVFSVLERFDIVSSSIPLGILIALVLLFGAARDSRRFDENGQLESAKLTEFAMAILDGLLAIGIFLYCAMPYFEQLFGPALDHFRGETSTSRSNRVGAHSLLRTGGVLAVYFALLAVGAMLIPSLIQAVGASLSFYAIANSEPVSLPLIANLMEVALGDAGHVIQWIVVSVWLMQYLEALGEGDVLPF